jgi:hypothetical protein
MAEVCCTHQISSKQPNAFGLFDREIGVDLIFIVLVTIYLIESDPWHCGDALADIRLALAQGQPLGSERFSEIMCAAIGIRPTQRKPGRPMVKHEQSDRVEDQSDFRI